MAHSKSAKSSSPSPLETSPPAPDPSSNTSLVSQSLTDNQRCAPETWDEWVQYVSNAKNPFILDYENLEKDYKSKGEIWDGLEKPSEPHDLKDNIHPIFAQGNWPLEDFSVGSLWEHMSGMIRMTSRILVCEPVLATFRKIKYGIVIH